MSAELGLLAKAVLPAARWLLLEPPLGDRPANIVRTDVFSSDWCVARTIEAAEFAPLPSAQQVARAEQLLLFLPKSKPRLEALLQGVAKHISASASLWVVGGNQVGIKSAPKRLAKYFETVEKVASGNHCQLLMATNPRSLAPESEPSADAAWLPYQGWYLSQQAGLFNQGKVDAGSALLLQHLPKLYGSVLDMGCGSGVLSLAACSQGAEQVLAVDSSAVAIEATRQAAERNQQDCISVQASDVFSDIERRIGGRFDWIISNPPFHTGVGTNYQPAQRLIQEAPNYLKSGGRLLVVANRHLPYEQWFEGSFKRWEVLTQAQGFKLIQGYR